jgi:hypothetical protein
MTRNKDLLLRQITKEFLFEDVNVEDKQAGVNSLDGKVDSMMLDYDELATDEKSEDDIKLDVDLFTSKIAKFVENYDKILDVPSHIVNSALGHLKENYDEEIVIEFKKILFDVYDIKLDSMEQDVSAPLAGAAGPYSST